MTITIGTGTPVECDYLQVQGPAIIVWNRKKTTDVVLAYCLQPGEALRRDQNGDYHVSI